MTTRASRITPYNYYATVDEVTDGDTVVMTIDQGLRTYRKEKMRLYGLDTPEMHAADPVKRAKAEKAKAFMVDLLPPGLLVEIETHLDQDDKFGRLLVTIYLRDANGTCVNEALLERGLAVAYSGGKKTI